MYSHIFKVDDELWDIIENDVTFQVDYEGMTVDSDWGSKKDL